jgi:hypothetical protein
MNIDKLTKALEDNSNEPLLNFTSDKLREMNNSILKELSLSNEQTRELSNKLRHYKYIDEMSDLKYGTYLRWISLKDSNKVTLARGAIFCEVKITDDGVFIVCKNFINTYFQIKMDEYLIFRKLTGQELVLLSALDHLSN